MPGKTPLLRTFDFRFAVGVGLIGFFYQLGVGIYALLHHANRDLGVGLLLGSFFCFPFVFCIVFGLTKAVRKIWRKSKGTHLDSER